MNLDLSELRKTFFQDAEDHLAEIEAALLELEKNLKDSDSLNAMFRSVHSLKGDSGFLGFESIERYLHQFETLLDKMRDGETAITMDTVDMMIKVVDQIEPLIEAAKTDSPVPEGYQEALSLLVPENGLLEKPVENSAVSAATAPELVQQTHAGETTAGESAESSTTAPPTDYGLFEDEVNVPMAVIAEPAKSDQANVACISEPLPSPITDSSENGETTPPEAQSSQIDVEPEDESLSAEDLDPDLLAEFIGEAKEHLESAEDQMLVIEGEPGNSEALDAIYRAFHTIKGVASFLGLSDTRRLAHQAESLLNLARDGRLLLARDAFEVALASVDGLKRQIGFVESWLTTRGVLGSDPQLPALLAAIDAVVNGKTPESLPERASAHEEGRPGPASAKPSPTPATTGNKSLRPDTQIKESIKVDRDRLDKLINVIGELVIGQAMVEEEVAAWQASVGHESLAMSQLNKTVRDLQELSLSLRMVPVGSAFHKMARIVRDLGRKLNKQIRFETEGDETELDKTVVDQIGDPLLHMVRNAADHGIESPEERVAAGKPPEGRVALRAYHQGGNIYIEIEDDGRGLNREALLAKAIERGIVSETDVLSDGQIDNLIFAPGFSTAKQVTDVSGRGVGMDVVRRNVEALQGSVSVSSRFGKGSTVVIRLPLTLAILDGLSIRVGQEVYIVPILSVVESFRPQHSDVKHIGGRGEVVMVRGEVVPLLRLGRLLHIPTNNDDQHPANDLVVIVEDRGRKYALLVDELLGQSQVVIKNLETNYRKVDGVAGATILGDGRIAMILDVFGLVCLIGNGQPSGHRDVYMESMAATDDDVEVFESL